MTHPDPSSDDLTRIPGLFRKWELPEVLETCTSYRIESAGAHADGTPLLAIFGDLAGVSGKTARLVEHLSEKELARRWRMSPRSLQRWRYERTGPPFLKISSRVIYPLKGVEVYERSGRTETTAAHGGGPHANRIACGVSTVVLGGRHGR